MQLSLSGQGAPEVAWFPFPVDVMTGKMNPAAQLRTVVIAFVLEPGFAANPQSAAADRSLLQSRNPDGTRTHLRSVCHSDR